MKRLIILFLTALFLAPFWPGVGFVLAQDESDSKAELYYFYGATCPHCEKAGKFLDGLAEHYPGLEIKRYEVFNNRENARLFLTFLERSHQEQKIRVPAIFIRDEVIIGYLSDETTGKKIKEQVRMALAGEEELGPEGKEGREVSLPFIGKLDPSKMSLPLLTIIIGGLDGFNPCAMWILLFLIALLINTRSRKRMWLVGGTFILASGVIYYLLLTAWLNLFLAISYINLTRIVIGVLAIGVGLWQLRGFYRHQAGVCKITAGQGGFQERIKKRLQDHTKRVALSPFTWALLGGVILLAFGVNLIEFFCSAGLPAIYTKILTLNELSSLSYYLYLLLYTFVFMLDDLIILFLAIITLSRFGFTEKYNKWATLAGGLLILLLGFLLIFKPGLLTFG